MLNLTKHKEIVKFEKNIVELRKKKALLLS